MGDLRLVDNSGNTTGVSAGRLEVYFDGEWGTVCDDEFELVDAFIACRQLGFATAINPSGYTVGTYGYV